MQRGLKCGSPRKPNCLLFWGSEGGGAWVSMLLRM